jgi:hypothetical protein
VGTLNLKIFAFILAYTAHRSGVNRKGIVDGRNNCGEVI